MCCLLPIAYSPPAGGQTAITSPSCSSTQSRSRRRRNTPLSSTRSACWYCSTVSVYRFTPGFTGKAGLAFNIKESGVHIDVAFQYSFTGKGNFFAQSGWWLAPVFGVLVRRR